METVLVGHECSINHVDESKDAQIYKPSVNLNKKGYAKLVEYVRENMDPPDVGNTAVAVLTDGFRETLRFDPAAKRSEEDCKRSYEKQKQLAKERGVSAYELSAKPRYERLKKQFPGLPPTVLSKSSMEEIEKLHLSRLCVKKE